MVRTAAAGDAAGFFAGLDQWSVLLALVSVAAGILLGVLAHRAALRLCARIPAVTADTGRRIARVVRLTVILLGVGITFLGAPIQPFLALAVIVAVVAGLALRGIGENFAAGLVLQTRRPFTAGDIVDVAGYRGAVREVTSRTVVVRTMDGRVAHIPNADVVGNPFVSESELGGRRSEAEVHVKADPADREEVRTRIADACAEVDGVHHREPVRVLSIAHEPHRYTVRAQYWHHAGDGPAVTAAVVDAIFAALGDREATVTSDTPPTPLTPPPEV
ncbi:mechanosensitive ion channel family protein [Leifsonia aquatica]|uniref:mechanosensitive ion channel family protein n=1 Tax=Leifsonia aquatica TaxID=144185 RepID=UPI0028AA11F9|nr:mechanosensitive ion channel domain-containing protein [Leifsonia aquatica]